MSGSSFISGLLGGFNEASTAARKANQDELDRADARESTIIQALANNPDVEPDIRSAATAAMLEKAIGNKPPKGGFINYLLGTTRAPTHDAVRRVLDMVSAPVVQEGLPVVDRNAPIAKPEVGSQQPQVALAGPPAQPAPAGASAAMVRGAGGPSTPGQLAGAPTAPAGPPSLNHLVGPPKLSPEMTGEGFQTKRTPVTLPPRPILIPESEQVRRASVAKAQGDVQGEMAGLIAAGVPEADARELIKQNYIKKTSGGAAGLTYAEGNIIPDKTSPTGWSQELYLRADPTKKITIPAQPPLTPEQRALNTTAVTNARMQAEAAGPLDSAQQIQNTIRLQDTWRKVDEPIQEMRRQMRIMETGLARFDADPVGSVEAIRVTFEKILDPTSVVREAEYARQTNGLSVGDKLQGLWQKWVQGGGNIPKPVLVEMTETARQFIKNMEGWTAAERARIDETARMFKLRPSLITGSPDVAAGPAGGAPGGNIAATPTGGTPPAGGANATPPGAPRVGQQVGQSNFVRTGTLPDGTKVGELPDGTIIPIGP